MFSSAMLKEDPQSVGGGGLNCDVPQTRRSLPDFFRKILSKGSRCLVLGSELARDIVHVHRSRSKRCTNRAGSIPLESGGAMEISL